MVRLRRQSASKYRPSCSFALTRSSNKAQFAAAHESTVHKGKRCSDSVRFRREFCRAGGATKIVRILFQHASKSPSARHIVARKTSREPRDRSVGTEEFSRFPRRCIGGRQETSLAREGKNIWRLRTLFYGAAARLRSHTAKTHFGHRTARCSETSGRCAIFWGRSR